MKKFIPKVGEKYWSIYWGLTGLTALWFNFENTNSDKLNIYTNNCFKYLREAQSAIKKIKNLNS